MSLLEKARLAKVKNRNRNSIVSEEEKELIFAFLNSEVTSSQVGIAARNSAKIGGSYIRCTILKMAMNGDLLPAKEVYRGKRKT